MHVHQVLVLIHEEKQQNRNIISMLYAVITRQDYSVPQVENLKLYHGAMRTLEQLAEALCDTHH